MLWTDRPIQNSVEGTIMRVEALVPGDSIVDYLKRRNNPCSRSRNLFVYFVDDRRFSINLFPTGGVVASRTVAIILFLYKPAPPR